jgi:hypothetical protein
VATLEPFTETPITGEMGPVVWRAGTVNGMVTDVVVAVPEVAPVMEMGDEGDTLQVHPVPVKLMVKLPLPPAVNTR